MKLFYSSNSFVLPPFLSQPAITCSKLTIETLEQGVKYVQVNEQVNAGWDVINLLKYHKPTPAIFQSQSFEKRNSQQTGGFH